jgi:hypothetical protein
VVRSLAERLRAPGRLDLPPPLPYFQGSDRANSCVGVGGSGFSSVASPVARSTISFASWFGLGAPRDAWTLFQALGQPACVFSRLEPEGFEAARWKGIKLVNMESGEPASQDFPYLGRIWLRHN